MPRRDDEDEAQEAGEGASWTPQAPEPTQLTRRSTASVTVRSTSTPIERTEVTPPPGRMDDEPTPEPVRPPVAARRTTRPTPALKPGSARATASVKPTESRGVLPTQDELAPVLKAAREAALVGRAFLLRLARAFVERVWRPTQRAATQKFRELLDQGGGGSKEITEETSGTFDAQRAKEWNKFARGGDRKGYLHKDDPD